jgi:hypothetical protein
MTPDEVKGAYAAVLMIGGASSKLRDIEDTVAWHRRERCWISSSPLTKLYPGLPVVARMAGESNELLMLGVVFGDWKPNDLGHHEDKWPHLLPVAWETYTPRHVKAVDILGTMGKARPAATTISKPAWRRVVNALLDA